MTTLDGTSGDDIIDGGNGADIIDAGAGDDYVDGGNGADSIDAGAGDDTVNGGNGTDSIDGGAGDDSLLGGRGNDTIDGGSGIDTVSGGNGDDLLIYISEENIHDVVSRTDIYDGGSGYDTLKLVITQSLATDETFLAELAQLQALLGTKSWDPFTFTSLWGLTVSTIEAVEVIVIGGNSGPTATDDLATVLEDGVLSLDADQLLANDTDPDGDLLSITAVGGAQHGSVQYVNGIITFTPDENYSGPASFTYTIRDPAGATSTATVVITVAPVADAPTLTVANATGNEDTAIALTLAALLTDPSEAFALSISGVPLGAVLSNGDNTATAAVDGAEIDITGWTLANLTITPPANSDADFALTVTATSTESDGSIATTIDTIHVSVAPVADDALITAQAVTATAGTPIPLTITVDLTDADGSEGIQQIAILGVPTEFTLSAGTLNDDGAWLVTQDDLVSLQLIPSADAIALTGTLKLTVSVTTIDGASTQTTSQPLNITIEAGANLQSGQVIDGYIVGATVFADTDRDGHLDVAEDANNNGVLDADEDLDGDGTLDSAEVFAITGSDGSFTLIGADPTAPLVMTGGVDISTGLAFTGTMTAAAGSTVITPLTTLVQQLVSSGFTGDAEVAVLAAFGIDASALNGESLGTFDPVPLAASGDSGALQVLSAAIQVQSTITQISAVTGDADAVVAALASAIDLAPNGTVDLSDAATTLTLTTTLLTDAGITDPAALNAVSAVVAAANASIQTSDDVTQLAQAAVVAQGETTEALATTVYSDPQAVADLTEAYDTNLAAKVSDAINLIGDVDGPLLGTLGNDLLEGNGNADAIEGLLGDDTLRGLAGNDTLYGGSGRDLLTGGTGSDRLDGGTDFDRVIFTDLTEGIAVNMAAGTATTATSGVDTLRGVEGIRGTNQNDSYDATGYSATSTNGGGAGYLISGGIGPQGSFNEFEGMGGDDTITGNGNTRLTYQNASDGVYVNLATGVAQSLNAGDTANIGVDSITGGIAQVRGSNFNDSLVGSATTPTEQFDGWGGNDTIDGNGGFDRVRYENLNTGSLGIAVDLGAGTVTGRDAVATSVVGTDTLRSIESVRGTNAADVYDASTFSATSTNGGGDQGNFNEFEGMGGNDTVIGNNNTRVSYANATGAVTVTLANGAGSATGNSSVGTDTFQSGVNQVRGSNFNDTLIGSNTGNNIETFDGWAGDDSINGGDGLDRARYDVNNADVNGVPLTNLGVAINLAAGTVTGRDAAAQLAYGTDTLRSVEMIRGSHADDIYDATGFGGGSTNAGSNGFFNEFEGLGGNDLITGNGYTRVSYQNASDGVNVDLSAGIAQSINPGDSANIGVDTITGGIGQVRGSRYDDKITSTSPAGNEWLDGQGGNDSISAGAGNDRIIGGGGNDTIDGGSDLDIAVFAGSFSQYTNTSSGTGGSSTVVDSVAGRDGTDTLTSVELLEFNDAYQMNQRNLDLSTIGLTNDHQLRGTNNTTNGDNLTIGTNANGRFIDLRGGGDTLTLATANVYNLNLANVETLIGSSGDDTVILANTANGLFVDLGGGSNVLQVADGTNVLSIQNVASVQGSDWDHSSDDTLTLLNNISGVNFNLADGSNTLNLAAGANTLGEVSGDTIIHGSASDDVLTLTSLAMGSAIDLGDGTDTVDLQIFGEANISLNIAGVEHVTSSGGVETVFLQNAASEPLSVDLGTGIHTLTLTEGSNILTVAGVFTLLAPGLGNDTVTFIADATTTNQVIDLGFGTDVITLEGANPSLAMSIYGSAATVYGSAATPNQSLTLLNQQSGNTYDLGDGTDELTLWTPEAPFSNSVSVKNIEKVTGSSAFDSITILNTDGTTTVTAGFGSDSIVASAAEDRFRFTSVQDSYFDPGEQDIIDGFNADEDQFIFADGLATFLHSPVQFRGDGTFSETGTTEARLVDLGGGVQLLEIDTDGDGVIGANDMTVELRNLTGTLTDANFVLGDPPVINSITIDAGGDTTGTVSEDGVLTATGDLNVTQSGTGQFIGWRLYEGAPGAVAQDQIAAGSADFTVRLDQFTVVKNGSVIFQDDFDDGAAPPSGGFYPNGNPATYAMAGAITESGGDAIMDGTQAAQLSTFSPTPYAFQGATLQTDTSSNPTLGLKSTDDFSVIGTFDLAVLDEAYEGYGIRLMDGVGSKVADDTMDLRVDRTSTGEIRVIFRDFNFVTKEQVFIDSMIIDPTGADQIVLRLEHQAANPGVVTASFDFLNSGSQVGSTVTFTNTGQIFGTGTPSDTSDDEVWTRGQFYGLSPVEIDNSQIDGVYGTMSIDANGTWQYSLNNDSAAVQGLDAGEIATDTFKVRVVDEFGNVDSEDIVVTVTGAPAPISIDAGGDTSGAVSEDGVLTATGDLNFTQSGTGQFIGWRLYEGAPGAVAQEHVTAGSADFTFRLDQFTVVKNGTTIFQDNFDDGIAPPSGGLFPNGNTASYSVVGSFTEAGGYAIMDDSQAWTVSTFGPRPNAFQGALLNTDTSTDMALGLKSDDNFSVIGTYDLILPDETREGYGIRFSDAAGGKISDDTMELRVVRAPTGEALVVFADFNFVTREQVEIESIAFDPTGADQITLRLNHDAASPGVVTAAFDLLSGGTVINTVSFTNTGQIFGTETPFDTSDDEVWTRGQFFGVSPVEIDYSQIEGVYGTMSIDANGTWQYTLNNSSVAVQGLGDGEIATDTFKVLVVDEFGNVDSEDIVVTVTGAADPITIDAGGDTTGAVTTNGVPTATGDLNFTQSGTGQFIGWRLYEGAPGAIAQDQVTAGSADFTFQLDQFAVIKNGTTIFEDNFDDGVAPPSGGVFPNGNTASYDVNGTITEAGGNAVMDDNQAWTLSTFSPRPFAFQGATLRTDSSTDLAPGLKIDDDFSVVGKYDLILPDETSEGYGIRLSDAGGGYGNISDDTMDLRLVRAPTGEVRVVFSDFNFVTRKQVVIESVALDPTGADQIVLRLEHQAANPGVVTAAFDLLNAGSVINTTSFANTGQIFGTDTLFTNDDEVWTRGQFFGLSPVEIENSQIDGVYGTMSIDANGTWQYALNNGSAAVQSLGDGEVASDTFKVLVDEFGNIDSEDIVVTVTAGNNIITGDSGSNLLMGTAFADEIYGLDGGDTLQGYAGDDLLDGGAGSDFVFYQDATAGITVNLAAGIVTGDALVGTDTLRSIELVRGTNDVDVFNAFGFGFNGASNIGSSGTFNEFEGLAGNDIITGNGFTRIAYRQATSGVTVDIDLGTASGDASVGSDTFTGVSGVVGSAHNDTLYGSSGGNLLRGGAGDDYLDGRDGQDVAQYAFDNSVTQGITVDLAAGTVVGGSRVGSDTLRSIEEVQATNFADSFDATGFSDTSTNAGSLGTFNIFQGMGGDDDITGNGNTTISYFNAAGGVSVDLVAGNAVGDTSVGSDTINGGVNGVIGSNFNDTITGSSLADTLFGQSGNDRLDGSAGGDALYGGEGADVFVFTDGWGSDFVADFVTGIDTIDMTGVTGLDTFAQLTFNQIGSSLEVSFGGNTITVNGAALGVNLFETDFLV